MCKCAETLVSQQFRASDSSSESIPKLPRKTPEYPAQTGTVPVQALDPNPSPAASQRPAKRRAVTDGIVRGTPETAHLRTPGPDRPSTRPLPQRIAPQIFLLAAE